MSLLKMLIVMVFLGMSPALTAQSKSSVTNPGDASRAGAGQQVSVLIHKTVGVFERSHGIGFGADYTLAPGRFGMQAVPSHKIGWIARGGVDFFLGKKDPTEGYAFRYSNYLYVHVMGGAMYNPVSFASIFLMAGPGIGIYSGGSSVGLHAAFAANLFVDQRLSVGPTLTFRQHPQADGLWTAGVRVGWTLPD